MLARPQSAGAPAFPWGRAVTRAFAWDAEDRRTPRWFPQGISTSADADDTERVDGRAVVVVAWYFQDEHGNNQGSRITFVDLATLRYRHVLLVSPRLRKGAVTLAPLKVHAGGIVWRGPYLHIAATTRGFVTCRIDDLMRIPDERGGRTCGASASTATRSRRTDIDTCYPRGSPTRPSPTRVTRRCGTPSSPSTVRRPAGDRGG